MAVVKANYVRRGKVGNAQAKENVRFLPQHWPLTADRCFLHACCGNPIIDCEGTCTSTILPSLSVTCQVCSAPSTCTTVARSGCPKALSATIMVTVKMAPSRRSVPGQDWRCIAFLLSVSRIPQCGIVKLMENRSQTPSPRGKLRGRE